MKNELSILYIRLENILQHKCISAVRFSQSIAVNAPFHVSDRFLKDFKAYCKAELAVTKRIERFSMLLG